MTACFPGTQVSGHLVARYLQKRRGDKNLDSNWASLVAQTVKNLPTMQENQGSKRVNPWFRKIPWRRAWQPTLVFLPGEFRGQKNLAIYSPWGCKDLDMTEGPTFRLLLQC